MTAPLQQRKRRRGIFGRLVISGLLVASAATSAISLAIFTDTETVIDNEFDTATIDLTASPTTALVSMADMVPGDVVNGSLTLSNAGEADLRFAMTTAADDTDSKGLRDELQITVREEGTDCATFDGTVVVATTDLASAAFGDATQGADAGDRTLAASASETLCFRVELPLAAGNAFQDATTTAVFTFEAEQTANNP